MSGAGGVIRATYAIAGDAGDTAAVEARATALAVEQSHEFPTGLAPAHAARSLARVVDVAPPPAAGGPGLATVEFPADLAGGELPQLLVLLFGNSSLQPGIRLIDADLPAELVARIAPAGRPGATGVRELLGAPTRPLLATALKPVGLAAAELAELAFAVAAGGIDLVKDDQGLADQPWAPFDERVARCADAVARANALTGAAARYLPALNAPAPRLLERAARALDAGAGGFLVLPGVTGFDAARQVAAQFPGVPLMAHPALLGAFVADPGHGIAPGLLFGPLLRLAGADIVVFPSYGGRFAFTREECRAIADGCRRPVEGLPAALPAPGGGMSVERVPELVQTYGPDVVLLIGGELHRDGDPRRAAERFRAVAEAAADAGAPGRAG